MGKGVQCKVLYRFSFTHIRHSKSFPNVESICHTHTSLAHAFWRCPNVFTCLNSIFKVLSDIFFRLVIQSDSFTIFWILGENNNLPVNEVKITKVATLCCLRDVMQT